MRLKILLFKILAVPLASILGHKNLVRWGNFLARAGRLDYPNNMALNGELKIQELILQAAINTKVTVIDCGANVGKWTLNMCREEISNRIDFMEIHCFEPSFFTYKKLCENVKGYQSDFIEIIPINKGLSSIKGTANLSIAHQGAGINSVETNFGSEKFNYEKIEFEELDKYVDEHRLPRINFLKIDTEGHDAKVLRGARELITEKRIDMIQFEYNWLWIEAGEFLKDSFNYLISSGYHVGKITPHGVQFKKRYLHEMENFEECNYFACTDKYLQYVPKSSH